MHEREREHAPDHHHDKKSPPPADEDVYEPHIADTYELKLLASTDHLRSPNPHHNLSLTHSRSIGAARGLPRGYPYTAATSTAISNAGAGAAQIQHHHAHSFTGGRPSSLGVEIFLDARRGSEGG
ncbi:DNA replication regulator sld2, partial [Ascosphaera pollenicola]